MSSTPTASNLVRLHVEDSGGSGRPVVLIHGWPLSAEAWQSQVGPLSEAGYRVIAYDRRGFGRSDKPESGFDYDTLAADLAGLLEEHDLRDVTLVGFSRWVVGKSRATWPTMGKIACAAWCSPPLSRRA